MRLTRVALKNYKHLKNIELNMLKEEGGENFPVYFCIGVNGSGKSSFLEAIALIFSRISQNELPGFWFEIEYDIVCEGRIVHVKAAPGADREPGKLSIDIDGRKFYSFTGLEKYLPYKVVTYVSGPNSQMKQLVMKAAEDSIISDIYDAVRDENASLINESLQSLAVLGSNPRILYLDEGMAVLILFVLCAWMPRQDEEYAKKRNKLFEKWSGGFIPKALSISAGNDIEGSLFGQFFEKRTQEGKRGFADWITAEEEGITAVLRVAEKKGRYCVPEITDSYTNPLQLLTVLLQAKNRGELKECHVLFQTNERKDFLNEKALSDGELLWIARMGLVLLAGTEETDNCLFLFDEPDIHLNENWNVEFVSNLEMLAGRARESRRNHSFWISTHSSLLLTDALPDQVFLFERNQGMISARRVPISFFGASRHEISKRAFENSAQIGEFAEERIEAVLQGDETPEELLKYIDMTGAGIQRFRLLDKYYEKIGEQE